MGLFDRVLGLFDGGDDEATAGSTPEGSDPDDASAPDGGEKTGSHGSHWDALVEGDHEIQQTVMETIQDGELVEAPSVDGREITGHRAGDGAVRTVGVTADGQMWTAYPVVDGLTHEVEIDGLIPWSNGVEAQLRGQLGPVEINFFPTNFFAEADGAFGGERRVELAGLAYDCSPADPETVRDEPGEELSTEGMAAFFPFERGDVDDYAFQTRVKEVEEVAFGDRTVYRLLASLFRTEDGDDVDISLYASEHVLGEYVPEVGDDVTGVLWLQGRVE